jgi:hypothetical protein
VIGQSYVHPTPQAEEEHREERSDANPGFDRPRGSTRGFRRDRRCRPLRTLSGAAAPTRSRTRPWAGLVHVNDCAGRGQQVKQKGPLTIRNG